MRDDSRRESASSPPAARRWRSAVQCPVAVAAPGLVPGIVTFVQEAAVTAPAPVPAPCALRAGAPRVASACPSPSSSSSPRCPSTRELEWTRTDPVDGCPKRPVVQWSSGPARCGAVSLSSRLGAQSPNHPSDTAIGHQEPSIDASANHRASVGRDSSVLVCLSSSSPSSFFDFVFWSGRACSDETDGQCESQLGWSPGDPALVLVGTRLGITDAPQMAWHLGTGHGLDCLHRASMPLGCRRWDLTGSQSAWFELW